MNASVVRAPAPVHSVKQWPEWKGSALTGCLRQLQRDPLGLYQGAWRELGDFVRFCALPRFYFSMVAHPDAIEHVLHSNPKTTASPTQSTARSRLMAGRGMLTAKATYGASNRR